MKFSLRLFACTVALLCATPAYAAYPVSNSYQLKAYGIGTGGSGDSSSSTYSINGLAGDLGLAPSASNTLSLGAGFNYTQQANVPTAQTFDNPANYYDKLHIVIGTGSNPSDAKYAVAISTDNFSTTSYVKSDGTVGSTLTYPTDYRDYSGWGSGTGVNVIGLTSSTTYKVKVKAIQGKFTETGYGPTASAATVGQMLSLCLYTGANCGAGGNTIAFGVLPISTVTSSPANISADFATNANNGGKVYLYANHAGLYSAGAPGTYTITSATVADLTAVSEGFGALSVSATQSSGGPFTAVSPYNVSSPAVGIVDTTIRELFSSPGPVFGGSGSIALKAKPSASAPAANDYQDILTVIAAASF